MNYLMSQPYAINAGVHHDYYDYYCYPDFGALPWFQTELLNTQNALKNLSQENHYLKTIIKNLQDQIAEKQINTKPIKKDKINSKEFQSSPKSTQISSNDLQMEEIDAQNESQSNKAPGDQNLGFLSPSVNIIVDEETLDSEVEEIYFPKVPIRRRNGFKPLKESDSDCSGSKESPNKCQRSKTKHIWVSYGRKIAEYAEDQSHGALREYIKEYHKLTSKRGYIETFLINSTDTEQQKEFKKKFGELALEFLEKGVENSFLSSNYRDELFSQKGKVQSWIKKHLGIIR